MNAEGDEIGRVVEIRHGTAYVDPDPSMFDTIKSKLSWGDIDEDTYPLKKVDVADVTDNEIRLSHLPMAEKQDTNRVVAERPGIKCPICHSEVHHSIEAHIGDAHTREELASFVVNYVLEQEEMQSPM